MRKENLKVAYILAYKDPRYVRTQFFTHALASASTVSLLKVINKSKNVLRYPEVIGRLLWLRLVKRPDVYVLGFRGTEIFLAVWLLTLGKPLLYDEFLNPYLWAVEEHAKFSSASWRAKILRGYLRFIYRRSKLVFSDTNAHAAYSIALAPELAPKFVTLFVGTDEALFVPQKPRAADGTVFEVFFYGNFLPLHGIDQILEAAHLLAHHKNIHFTIIGGGKRKAGLRGFNNRLRELGLSNVEHKPWAPIDELPRYIANADLCLGGPFGNTPQAQKVITGKTYQFLAMGAPTLVGKIDEETEFVDGKNCLIVPQGSAEALAQKIEWAFANRDKLAAIGRRGGELYAKTFSKDAQQHKLVDAIRNLD